MKVDAMPVTFNRTRAKELIECFKTGKPISPPQVEGWKVSDMLFLAGACFYGVARLGPMRDEPMPPTPEGEEAIREKHLANILAAIQAYGHLTTLVANGDYDRQFGEEVEMLASAEELTGKTFYMDPGGKK